MITPLLGMRTTGMLIPLLQQPISLHQLIKPILFMQQIWMGMEIWISFRLLFWMIPLLGMRTTGMLTLALQQPILLHRLMEHDLFMQQTWMGMGIWMSFRLLLMMTPLRGMRTTVMQTLALQLLLSLRQLTMHELYMPQIWMGMEIWISFLHLKMMTPLLGMRLLQP